jgi:hypothetical protein
MKLNFGWHSSLSLLAFTLILSNASLEVKAQLYSTPRAWLISQKFQPPIGNDPKPATTGGATRGGATCFTGEKGLTPLLPANKLGLTFRNNPTFFWYTPPTPVKTAEFVIATNDDEDQELYKTTLTLPDKSGIVGFTLPKDVSILKEGKTYHWTVTVICDPKDPGENPHLDGLVKLTSPNKKLSQALAVADPSIVSNLYAKNGIWYEALDNLVKLRKTKPQNQRIKQNWQDFLGSVGLDNMFGEPFVDLPPQKNS